MAAQDIPITASSLLDVPIDPSWDIQSTSTLTALTLHQPCGVRVSISYSSIPRPCNPQYNMNP